MSVFSFGNMFDERISPEVSIPVSAVNTRQEETTLSAVNIIKEYNEKKKTIKSVNL